MICYRDKTFCPFWETCSKGALCDRALTQKVHEEAKEWWGSDDAPICVYVDNPECFEAKKC